MRHGAALTMRNDDFNQGSRIEVDQPQLAMKVVGALPQSAKTDANAARTQFRDLLGYAFAVIADPHHDAAVALAEVHPG